MMLALGFAAALLAASAGNTPAPPAPDALPALAEDLAAKIETARVRGPDGAEIAVASVLDRTRLERCLETISEAGAWPAAWLVVEDSGLDVDLVLRLALGADGNVEAPETMFASPRRDWDHDAFEAAYRDAFGRKPPRERDRNLVVQSFSKRTVTTYVYDLPETGAAAKGLLALLPAGSLPRETRAIRWSDGRLLTLAIVLVRPTFVPSSCDAAATVRDHADSGGVMAYLVSAEAIEASVELTDRFRDGPGGVALVPRYACAPGDVDATDPDLGRFEERPQIDLAAISRPDDGRDEILARVAGVDRGQGRSEVAVLRIASRDDGVGVTLSLD